MKKLLLSMVCCLMMISFQSFAQEEGMNEEMMKAWQEYMTPSETHEKLAKSDGTWKAEMTMWMVPGSEPMKNEGIMTNEMILGGRYQKSTFKGDMMGMPMEGMSLLAYDNAAKEYISIWIDNMGTGMMVVKGRYDEDTKMVDLKGTYVDPMTGKEEPVRETFQVVDDNHHVMEMFMYMEGKEYKNMHIDFTRQ